MTTEQQIPYMENKGPLLRLRQKKLNSGQAKDSLYMALCIKEEGSDQGVKVREEDIKALGFVEVLKDNSNSRLLPSLIYHHFPTGSTVQVIGDRYSDNIYIYGNNCVNARKDLETLARLQGLELEE